uniref:MalT-like TPR region domain-containing protein n=1 Tax=Ascaris lumbricoides TaxID=6252 RepID=A0A9J2PZE2_ASCLU
MLRSLVTCRNIALRCRPACSFVNSTKRSRDRYDQRGNRQRQRSNSSKQRGWKGFGTTTVPLFGLSWLVTIKDMLGIERFKTDDDPLKDKVKKAFISRKYGRYEEAVSVLEEALAIAKERGEELPISRVYDELANTYYEMGKLDDAERLFRLLIRRMIELHDKHESDPEFIGVSLKLADIFAQKGQIENAETGYRHCVMEEHLKKYVVAEGALAEHRHQVEAHGAAYTDPIALFGMCLEQYAHFLVNYRGEDRLPECEEYMDEVLKISYQIYGANSFHMINILNNFGAALILKHRFELARKYLSLGIDRILHVDECSGMLPGYYCNYAEALFHCGQKDQALEYARKAVNLSRSEEPRVQEYARRFLQEMEKDIKGTRRRSWLWLW